MKKNLFKELQNGIVEMELELKKHKVRVTALPDLPDDFSQSKDWKAADYATRVELLKYMVEDYREEMNEYLDQLGECRKEYYALLDKLNGTNPISN